MTLDLGREGFMFSACANPDCKKSLTTEKGARFDFAKRISLVNRLRTLIPCSTSGCVGDVRRSIR
jgi:hypothetical protein